MAVNPQRPRDIRARRRTSCGPLHPSTARHGHDRAIVARCEQPAGDLRRVSRGRYDLEVIDIYQQPVLTKGEQIVAAPTLIKKLPLPMRRIIGDMSNRDACCWDSISSPSRPRGARP